MTGKKNFSVINSCEVAISVVKSCQWKIHLVNLEQKTGKIIHAQLGSLDDIVSSEQHLFYLAADKKIMLASIARARNNLLPQSKLP